MDRHPYQMPCVPWAQRHHCEREKLVRGNKHLSCANWSVKCTNCGGEGDVSAGVTALGLGAMSGPGISWGAPLPLPSSPPLAPPLAEGHNGNYYLLDVCLISSYSSWLAITGPQGCVAPPCVIAEGQQWQNHLWRAFRSFIQSTGCQPQTKLPTFVCWGPLLAPLPSGWAWMRAVEGAQSRMSESLFTN